MSKQEINNKIFIDELKMSTKISLTLKQYIYTVIRASDNLSNKSKATLETFELDSDDGLLFYHGKMILVNGAADMIGTYWRPENVYTSKGALDKTKYIRYDKKATIDQITEYETKNNIKLPQWFSDYLCNQSIIVYGSLFSFGDIKHHAQNKSNIKYEELDHCKCSDECELYEPDNSFEDGLLEISLEGDEIWYIVINSYHDGMVGKIIGLDYGIREIDRHQIINHTLKWRE